MSETYPQRKQFYSHRFCRLLTKTAAAQEIGPEACWLLTVVAHQEDSKHYSGPVTFWNEQLMPLCGFGGRRRLVLARQKAVDAGWLHYAPGGKHRAGTYWTLIPERFARTPDGPMDENSDDFCRSAVEQQRESSRSETEHQTERQDSSRSEMTAKPERQTCADRNGKRALTGTANVRLSTLTLNPSPNPNPKGKGSKAPGPPLCDLIQQWNSIEGIARCLKATKSRRQAYRARSADPGWQADVDAALRRVKESSFCRGANERGWKADIDWFLRPDTVTKILEGKYDDRAGERAPKKSAAVLAKEAFRRENGIK